MAENSRKSPGGIWEKRKAELLEYLSSHPEGISVKEHQAMNGLTYHKARDTLEWSRSGGEIKKFNRRYFLPHHLPDGHQDGPESLSHPDYRSPFKEAQREDKVGAETKPALREVLGYVRTEKLTTAHKLIKEFHLKGGDIAEMKRRKYIRGTKEGYITGTPEGEEKYAELVRLQSKQ